MTSLFKRSPKDSFQELLKLENTGAGIDSTLRSVQDGLGINTPLQLSTTQIALNGVVWPTSTGMAGQILTANADSTLSWQNVQGDAPNTTLIDASPSISGYSLTTINNQIYNMTCSVNAAILLPSLSALFQGWTSTIIINNYGSPAIISGNTSPQDYIFNNGSATGSMTTTVGYAYMFSAIPALNRWLVFKSI
jgi:hypothetical protein